MQYTITISWVGFWFLIWSICWIVEMAKSNMIGMCLSVGATFAMLTVWFHASMLIQLGVFVVLSAAMLALCKKNGKTQNTLNLSPKTRKTIMRVLIVIAVITLLLHLKMLPQTIDAWMN